MAQPCRTRALLPAIPHGEVRAAVISVDPTQGTRGSLVIVRGSEWPSNDAIELSWNFPPFYTSARVQANESGAFATTVVVPQGAPIGTTYVDAINKAGDRTWQAPFYVLKTEPTACGVVDAYFIGAHGTEEGPDDSNQILSPTIGETWAHFYDAARA